jgi:ParB family transcriptional regulator, chromosome partitioning protein
MARKNLLASIALSNTTNEVHESRTDYALRGASRTMKLSIDELAASARRLSSGETIVELDPALVDASPLRDRIDDDEGEFALFRDGLRDSGQHQPILVRPSSVESGRYVIVFGHRRARAARELGRPVLAIIKTMDDVTHVIAQGQENTRRKDYSFIEKALFAQRLLRAGHSKEVAKASLSVDDTLLSRMLSVTEIIPSDVIEAIGAARTVGRDRWEDLKKLFNGSKKAERAREIVSSEPFGEADSVGRFNLLLIGLKKGRNGLRRRTVMPTSSSWIAHDKNIAANWHTTGKGFNLSLTSRDASAFGEYISSRLEGLYESFRQANASEPKGA